MTCGQTADDFDAAGVQRVSPLHTKSRLAIAAGSVETTYYQASENVLAARVIADVNRAGHYVALQVDTGERASEGGSGRTGDGAGTYTAATIEGSVVILGSAGPAPGAWGISTDLVGKSKLVSTNFFPDLDTLRKEMDPGTTLHTGAANYTTNSSLLFVVLGFTANEVRPTCCTTTLTMPAL